MPYDRRRFIQGVTAAGVIGLAGCADDDDGNGGLADDGNGATGDDGNGDDGDDVPWPPDRDLVEVMVDTDPGGLIDVQARTWLQYVEPEWPDDVTSTVSNRPEANGIILFNELMDAATDGGMFGGGRINSIATNQIGAEEANFDVGEMEPLVGFSTDTRALQFNPRTTPVEDHFEMTWTDFQDLAEEQTLVFPYANAAQLVFAQYVRANDPILNEDNWQFVEVDGGSEARAAMERGDLDGYFGSYVSNYSARNDAYFTQFVFANPESEFYEGIADTMPEMAPTVDDPVQKTLRENDQALIINAENYPQDAAETAVVIVEDTLMLFLPPGTPQGIIDIHEEAWGVAAESEELADEIAEAFAPEDHNPIVGDPVREIAEQKIATFLENDEVRTLIEQEVF